MRMFFNERLGYVETLAWIKHTSLLGPEIAINFQEKVFTLICKAGAYPYNSPRQACSEILEYVETLARIKHTSLLGPERAINFQKSILNGVPARTF